MKKNLSKNRRQDFNKKFKKIIKTLSSCLKMKKNVFVHRDFHVSNLMLVNNRIGVIDSQDALIGNKAYDLASLVDDVRLKTSKIFKKKIAEIPVGRIGTPEDVGYTCLFLASKEAGFISGITLHTNGGVMPT